MQGGIGVKLLSVIASFLKVGTIGFGGGSALIPVVEKEVVEDKKMVSSDDFSDYIISANITPGATIIKLSAACGEFAAGTPGLLAGSYAVALPGTLMTIALLSLLSILGSHFLLQVEKASVGITTFIIFLLIMYIIKVMKEAKSKNFFRQAIVIGVASTLLTFGKEIRQLATLLAGYPVLGEQPIFDISIINLLFISFFIIFFLGGRWERKKGIVAITITVAYLMCISKAAIIPFDWVKITLALIMFILILVSAYKDISKEIKEIKKSNEISASDNSGLAVLLHNAMIQVFWFLLLIITPFILLLFLTDVGEAFSYLVNGFISIITSFGGGEAYISVAEGVFVQTGFIPSSVFYSQILPIANALPGLILSKTLAGIGYIWGLNNGGFGAGWLAALLGLNISVGATGIVFVLVFAIYKRFSTLKIFKILKQWILPIICGLLVTTTISMLGEILRITNEAGLDIYYALPVVGGILFLCWYLIKKFHIADLLLILLSGLISLVVLSIC